MKKRKSLLRILVIALVISLVPNAFAADTVPTVSYDGIAGQIVNTIHAGWNLGNTLDSYGEWIVQYSAAKPTDFETAWGNPVTTKQMIESVRAAGFNAVRVPVTWTQHISDADLYEIDAAWMCRVKETVDYVIDSGMYCILNLHHDVGGDSWLKASTQSVSAQSQKFAAVWTQIAKTFAEYDAHLLFEGFNEILDEENHWVYPGKTAADAVNTLNQLFVDTVRSTGGNNRSRCLVVNTYAAGTGSAQLDDFVLPFDSTKNALIVQAITGIDVTCLPDNAQTVHSARAFDRASAAFVQSVCTDMRRYSARYARITELVYSENCES